MNFEEYAKLLLGKTEAENWLKLRNDKLQQRREKIHEYYKRKQYKKQNSVNKNIQTLSKNQSEE
jgi:hypothetical protein